MKFLPTFLLFTIFLGGCISEDGPLPAEQVNSFEDLIVGTWVIDQKICSSSPKAAIDSFQLAKDYSLQADSLIGTWGIRYLGRTRGISLQMYDDFTYEYYEFPIIDVTEEALILFIGNRYDEHGCVHEYQRIQ